MTSTRKGTAGELVVDHQSAGGPTVTHVRGTLLVSSIAVVTDIGQYANYLAALAPAARTEVLGAPAMSWVPMAVALAHYRACDALLVSDTDLAQIAEGLSRRYADSIFGTMLRAARQAGVDAPWFALRSLGRIWDRAYLGGGVRVYRTGPKDVYFEQRGLPLAEIPYFRTAHLLWVRIMCGLVVKSLRLRLVPPNEPSPSTLAFAASWV